MSKPILSSRELEHLADVIGQVEETTSGEIRLMIVSRSSRTLHVQAFICCLLLSAYMTLLIFEPQLGEPWCLATALVGSYVLSALLARWSFLQRGLTHFADLHDQVQRRAELEFYREGLNQTHAHTGVLLFVSLFERQAVVLADEGISSKAPPDAWNQVVKTIVQGARTKQWAPAFDQALRECGTYLSAHFPPEANKSNELPNTVIVKD